MSKQIGTLGTIDTLTVDGAQFADLSNMKCLIGAGSAGNPHSSGAEMGSATSYQVPVGKTFRILAIQMSTDTVDAIIGLGYSTNSVGPAPTAAAYSGYVDAFAGSATPQPLFQKLPATPLCVLPLKFDVPAGKYVALTYVGGTGGAVYEVFGIEV